MPKYLKLFIVAFGISFIGSLPIGTLNADVADYGLKGDIKGGFEFGLAAIFVEAGLVRLTLLIFDKIGGLQRLFKYLSVVMCAVILLLAYKSLEAAFHMRNFQDILPFVGMNAIYSGLALSLLNPLQIPFWMGWTLALKNRKILAADRTDYNVYIAAIAAGTATAFLIYGIAGDYLMNTLKAQHNLINWILGVTLLLTGLVLAYKLLARKLWLNRGGKPLKP